MEQQYPCNKPSSSSSSRAADRKTIEKNRRNQMKDLYMKLNSLVHHDQHSKVLLFYFSTNLISGVQWRKLKFLGSVCKFSTQLC